MGCLSGLRGTEGKHGLLDSCWGLGQSPIRNSDMLKRGKRAMHAALLRTHGVLIRASAPRDSS